MHRGGEDRRRVRKETEQTSATGFAAARERIHEHAAAGFHQAATVHGMQTARGKEAMTLSQAHRHMAHMLAEGAPEDSLRSRNEEIAGLAESAANGGDAA